MISTVSKGFYDLTVAQFPQLATSTSYRMLFGTIILGIRQDDQDRPMVSSEWLSICEGKAFDKNYSGKRFLEKFNRDVVQIRYSDWCYTKGECRVITEVDLPESYVNELQKELARKLDKTTAVDFFSGKPLTKHSKAEQDTFFETYCNAHTDCAVALEIQSFLNSQSSNKLTRLIDENFDSAFAISNDYNKKLLNDLKLVSSKCLYTTTSNSPRIFPTSRNVCQLHKTVRNELLKGCVELDLKFAHFAVNSMLWDSRILQEACLTDIWHDLTSVLTGVDTNTLGDVKSVLKSFIYSLFFGMSKQRAFKDCSKSLSSLGVDSRELYSHRIVKEILKKRKIVYRQIEEQGYGVDAFGRKLVISEDQSAPSIAAQIAQSYEVKIMHRVIQLAKQDPSFTPLVWLHDAVVLAGCTQAQVRHAKQALRDAALECDIRIQVTEKSL